MNYAVEMRLNAMIYVRVPSFIQISLVIQKLMWDTHTQEGDLISLHLIFQNKENRHIKRYIIIVL
jgi:uncharacterized protein (UPF0262 family)